MKKNGYGIKVKETPFHLRTELTKNRHLEIATRSSTQWETPHHYHTVFNGHFIYVCIFFKFTMKSNIQHFTHCYGIDINNHFRTLVLSFLYRFHYPGEFLFIFYSNKLKKIFGLKNKIFKV
jgi:hypothetical protein